MVELKDEVVGITELKIVDRGHKHDFSNCKFLDPVLTALDS
jgi:hypothetical protein